MGLKLHSSIDHVASKKQLFPIKHKSHKNMGMSSKNENERTSRINLMNAEGAASVAHVPLQGCSFLIQIIILRYVFFLFVRNVATAWRQSCAVNLTFSN